jgi:hypothetical protein
MTDAERREKARRDDHQDIRSGTGGWRHQQGAAFASSLVGVFGMGEITG